MEKQVLRHPPGGGKKIVTRHAKKIKLYESNNLAKTMSYNNEAVRLGTF
ncbi:MAG: hypothetical protein PVF82_10360 [Gammaproteobacteria bacterium]